MTTEQYLDQLQLAAAHYKEQGELDKVAVINNLQKGAKKGKK